LIRSLLKDGRGYSLIEVMVSIIILAIAILPMAGMFDMGLNGVTASSHYDKARTLANLKLEQAKNLPFTDVEGNFPDTGITTPYDGSDWFTEPGADFANFQYTVYKDYMQEGAPDDQTPSRDFDTSGTPTGLIRLTVEVRWGDDNDGNGLPDKSFTTFGLVAQ
jgi:prepilin-type N-terminal cleavage/methylation domain-containing protein